jgi:hypothetical protein
MNQMKMPYNCTIIGHFHLLKDHGRAGITASMKNHYGSVDKPGNLHGGQCNPYVAELNNIPEIRDKTRLIMKDSPQ